MEDYLGELQIDWPVSILNQQEVACYKAWLQGKTHLSVEIPTEPEWEWFALGEMVGAKFPWGNETEDPPAAVSGVDIAIEDHRPVMRDQADVYLVHGMKVGVFPPNSWGLRDIIANLPELTSTVRSGEELYDLHAYPSLLGRLDSLDGFAIKGGAVGDDLSQYASVEKNLYSASIDGRYSGKVAIRFVLTGTDIDE